MWNDLEYNIKILILFHPYGREKVFCLAFRCKNATCVYIYIENSMISSRSVGEFSFPLLPLFKRKASLRKRGGPLKEWNELHPREWDGERRERGEE